MRIFLVLLCMLFVYRAHSQVIINGKLVDEQQKPIPHVSVSVSIRGEVSPLAATQSDAQGQYRLSMPLLKIDSVQLDFQHISFTKHSVTVANRSASYAYQLLHAARQMEEVSVPNTPIFSRKDTINYDVNKFTSKQDRVISDIIKKLPGIEIQGGRIFYQGKPIQKLTVNNLDLMQGRYAMINNNLPADLVKYIQVIEKSNPVSALDSLEFSDGVSLNLQLKKFSSSGTGKIGLGYQPVLWDLNLTPMTFGKTFQMLNSFQTNNTGYDASKDLRPFYTGGGTFRSRASISNGDSFVAVRNVASPNFQEEKWLNNKIFLFSANTLQVLKGGVEFKTNISYYDDTRKREGYTATQYFSSEDIIYSSEKISNSYRNKVFDVGVLLEKNQKKVYFRNSTKYQKNWSTHLGNVLFNKTQQIGQHRDYSDEAFLNNMSIARFIGKQLVNISSTLEYNRTPQQLLVNPGQFEDLLNNGSPFDEMTQQVLFKRLSFDNSFGFTRKIKRWSFSPLVALNYDQHQLNTSIFISDKGQENALGTDYINDMHNAQLNWVMRMRLGWENKRWKLSVTAPWNLYHINVRQQSLSSIDGELKKTFNPTANLHFFLNTSHEFSAALAAGTTYGGLNNFYNGYIISQYRKIQRYDARLLRTDRQSASVAYLYKQASKGNFANFNYSYAEGVRDYIFSTKLDKLGRTTTSIVDKDSRNNSHKFTAGISRLFNPLKTVVKVNGNLQWTESDYMLNGLMDKQSGRGHALNVEFINNLSTLVFGDFKTSYGRQHTIYPKSEQLTVYKNYFLNIVVNPLEKHSLSLQQALYTNNIKNQGDQFFLDLTYRFRLSKWKTDLEFNGQNLFNNNKFVQQLSPNVELVQTTFELRPRQFLLTTRFKF